VRDVSHIVDLSLAQPGYLSADLMSGWLEKAQSQADLTRLQPEQKRRTVTGMQREIAALQARHFETWRLVRCVL